jgi:hypothetical protein
MAFRLPESGYNDRVGLLTMSDRENKTPVAVESQDISEER